MQEALVAFIGHLVGYAYLESMNRGGGDGVQRGDVRVAARVLQYAVKGGLEWVKEGYKVCIFSLF